MTAFGSGNKAARNLKIVVNPVLRSRQGIGLALRIQSHFAIMPPNVF
jgi:hypothetical protein